MNTTAFYSREVTELLKTGTIYGINGPVIYLKGNTGFRMSEMVYVGHEKLVGEVISLDKDLTTIQVLSLIHILIRFFICRNPGKDENCRRNNDCRGIFWSCLRFGILRQKNI